MTDTPDEILVTGDDQYGFGCVHGEFPLGRTEKYIRSELYEQLQQENARLKVFEEEAHSWHEQWQGMCTERNEAREADTADRLADPEGR